MFKTTVAAVAAAVLLSPAAFAEGGKMVTLSHDYDAALVSSDTGASVLLAQLERAAKRTCTSRIPGTGGQYMDAACADALLVAAVKQIHETHTAAGLDVAPAFERIALTQLASAD
ncbi:MAG: UrcA family protein [Hyphomonas sp.]|jgi:UrcA family protein|nr:UrcA family protein [Hyphomonas sp.]